MDPARRELFTDWERSCPPRCVAKFRADSARHLGDPDFEELIQALRAVEPGVLPRPGSATRSRARRGPQGAQAPGRSARSCSSTRSSTPARRSSSGWSSTSRPPSTTRPPSSRACSSRRQWRSTRASSTIRESNASLWTTKAEAVARDDVSDRTAGRLRLRSCRAASGRRTGCRDTRGRWRCGRRG